MVYRRQRPSPRSQSSTTASASDLLARRSTGPATLLFARGLPSIAARTLVLGVLASLWSSSSSSSSSSVAAAFHQTVHNHHKVRSTYTGWIGSPNRMHGDDGFRGGHGTGSHTSMHMPIGSSGCCRRWVHGHGGASPTTPLRSTGMGDETTTATTTSNPTSVRATSHLPRLFVEASSSSSSSSSAVAPIPLRENSLVPLTVDQEHYLLDVMRITNPKRWGRNSNSNDDGGGNDDRDYTGCVRIFNGVDGEWLARVVVPPDDGGNKKARRRKPKASSSSSSSSSSSYATSGTVVECLERLLPQEPATAASSSRIASVHLYLGYLKDKQRRRWVIEKATELGADGISLLDTDFSNAGKQNKYNNNNNNNNSNDGTELSSLWDEDREKHRRHAIEAAEQSERLTVPELSPLAVSVDRIADRINGNDENNNNENENDAWLVCRERSESSPPVLAALRAMVADCDAASASASSSNPVRVHVLVGPEGGWSPRELEVFSELDGVQFVSLGGTVLRAETAAIAAVGAVQMYKDTLLF